MGVLGSSALALGAAAAVVLAVVVAFHDLALERLRKYCIPTQEEAEWAAAYVDVADADVDILSFGDERLGGAESFLEEPDGCLLTGLWDGRIVRLLSDKTFQHVATTGLLSSPRHIMFAEEAEERVDAIVEKGAQPTPPSEAKLLLQAKDSAKPHVANAVTEETNGRVYVTDSSMRADAGRFGVMFFEGKKKGTGRLLSVDLKTDKAEVVGDQIPFANGAVTTFDKNGVLVSALTPRQIRRYPLKPKHTQPHALFDLFPFLEEFYFLDLFMRARQCDLVPSKCKYSAEVILHRWPGASESVLLVGSFRPEQPLCQQQQQPVSLVA
ncbi:hypothetical protein Emed_002050 [Eimeria media]